jgi:AcrR family transcriptional regulator
MYVKGSTASGPPSSQRSTKEKILNAAEQLFSKHGFDGTSLRMITSRAGVNLAAVNYHFRSKSALIEAIFARRLAAINSERLRLLEECELAAGEAPPPLEAVVRAFASPLIYLKKDAVGGRTACQLVGRMYVEPTDVVRRIASAQMKGVAKRFLSTFSRILPHLPQTELMWRLNFCVGVLAHTLAGTFVVRTLSEGACDPANPEETLERVVSFLSAGMRAPVLRAAV